VLRRPLRREVPVQIEPLERRRDLDRDAVVVLDPPLRQEAVERPVVRPVDRIAAYQKPGLLRMPLPGAVRVLDAHVEHSPVAVGVLHPQPVVLLLARVRPHG
jgi:hypothetical protein